MLISLYCVVEIFLLVICQMYLRSACGFYRTLVKAVSEVLYFGFGKIEIHKIAVSTTDLYRADETCFCVTVFYSSDLSRLVKYVIVSKSYRTIINYSAVK